MMTDYSFLGIPNKPSLTILFYSRNQITTHSSL